MKTDGHEFQILLLRKVMAGNGFLKSLGKKKSFETWWMYALRLGIVIEQML